MKGEYILHKGMDQRPFALFSRRSVFAVTNSRIICLKRGLIGGYHLSASAAGNAPTIGYLKLMPHEVLVNDDVPTSGGPIAEDNGDSVGVASNSQELYVYKDIPFGWTATAFRTFGNSTDTTRFYVYDITDTTATADSNTGTLNGAEITLASPVTSTATNYVGIHINVGSTLDNFYGGYIKIERFKN